MSKEEARMTSEQLLAKFLKDCIDDKIKQPEFALRIIELKQRQEMLQEFRRHHAVMEEAVGYHKPSTTMKLSSAHHGDFSFE